MNDTDRPPLVSRRAFLALGGGAFAAIVVAACGGDEGRVTPSTADEGEAVTEFTIVAESLAWDLDRIVVAVGREVTATIDNRDGGILHNLHVKCPGDPKTPLEEGPVVQTLRFTVEERGSYEFVCDAHLNMTGTIVAV